MPDVRHISTQFCRLCFLLFGASLLLLVLRGSFPLLSVVCAVATFWAVARYLPRFAAPIAALSPSAFRRLYYGGLLLLFALQIAAGFALCNDAAQCTFDSSAVLQMAKDLAAGHIPAAANDYFVTYSTNTLCMFVQYWLLCLTTPLGLPAAQSVMLLNALALFGAVFYTVRIARLLWGRCGALTAELCCLLFLPFFIFVPFVYTDTMSAPFVAAVLFYYLRLRRQWKMLSRCGRALNFAVMTLLLPVGCLMKGNAYLLCPALALHFLLTADPRMRLREKATLFAASLFSTAAVIKLFDFFQKTCGLIDFSHYDNYHLPFSMWIMMGLENNGGFALESYQYMYTFPTLAQKSAAALDRIAYSLHRLAASPAALAWLTATKLQTVWGDGLYNASAYATLAPLYHTAASEWLLTGGQFFPLVNGFGQCFYLLLWLGALTTAVSLLRGRMEDNAGSPALLFQVCLLGNLFFFLFWEANERYTFNFSCCLILLFVGWCCRKASSAENTVPAATRHAFGGQHLG